MVMMMMMMMNGLQKQIRTHEDVPNKVSTGEGGGGINKDVGVFLSPIIIFSTHLSSNCVGIGVVVDARISRQTCQSLLAKRK